MKIRFVGPGAGGVVRRLIGPYCWDTGTGYVQEVDAETTVALLTQPTTGFAPVAEFEIDAGEPLLTIKGIGVPQAGALALLGVGSVGELAALDKEGVERVAEQVGVSEKQARFWVVKAKAMTA